MTIRIRLALALLFLLLVTSLSYAGAASLIDPTSDPGGFLTQLIAFAHSSWPVAVAIGAYGLLEVASLLPAQFGKDIPWLAWLGSGRVSLVIAGGIAVLGAGLNAYLGTGSAQPALLAALVAGAAFWHPKAVVVAKMQAKAGFVRPRLMFALASVALAGMLAFACGATQKAAVKTLASCTEDAAAKQLEPTVERILTSGVSNWKQQLQAFAIAFGPDELDCVVLFAEQLMKAKLGGPVDAAAIARADEWLNHGKTSQAAPGPIDPRLAKTVSELSIAAVVEKCTDNLCAMDSYCSCHGDGDAKRCWSQQDDCQIDAACCDGHAKDCKAQGSDRCSQRTSDERKKREAKKAKP